MGTQLRFPSASHLDTKPITRQTQVPAVAQPPIFNSSQLITQHFRLSTLQVSAVVQPPTFNSSQFITQQHLPSFDTQSLCRGTVSNLQLITAAVQPPSNLKLITQLHLPSLDTPSLCRGIVSNLQFTSTHQPAASPVSQHSKSLP